MAFAHRRPHEAAPLRRPGDPRRGRRCLGASPPRHDAPPPAAPGHCRERPRARTVLVVATAPNALPAIAAALHDLVLDEDDSPDQRDEARRRGALRRPRPPERRHPPRHHACGSGSAAYRTGVDRRVRRFTGIRVPLRFRRGLDVPRRESPRTRIPAARSGWSPFSGIYPRPSPGGWQLIGNSDVRLWEPDRDPPVLLTPGHGVDSSRCRRERARRRTGRAARPRRGPRPAGPRRDRSDGERGGPAVPAPGQPVLGNDEGAPAVEVLLGGLAVQAEGAVRVCVASAPTPVAVDGRAAALGTPSTSTTARSFRSVRPSPACARTSPSAAVSPRPVLGSCSTDPTMGIGPAPLAPSRRLAAAAAAPANQQAADVDVVASEDPSGHRRRAPRRPGPPGRLVLAARREGPSLLTQPWTVTAEADQVGVRLAGPRLVRADDDQGEAGPRAAERGSRPGSGPGAARGAAAGLPRRPPHDRRIPVMAVVVDADTDVLGQLRPGDRVRFRRIPRGW